MGAADDQYFAPEPTVPSAPTAVEVVLAGRTLRLTTDAGVFSPDRVDPGTRLLLDRAPAPAPTGRFLDLGCGWGPIAIALALSAPAAEVVAVDVNARARALCEANIRDARRSGPAGAEHLASVTVAAPDDVDGTFDLVWSNPPIRVGKAALHDLLDRWLGRLRPGGRAILVVQRHLGADSLHRWLEQDRGHAVDRLASRQGYRLLQVVPGR